MIGVISGLLIGSIVAYGDRATDFRPITYSSVPLSTPNHASVNRVMSVIQLKDVFIKNDLLSVKKQATYRQHYHWKCGIIYGSTDCLVWLFSLIVATMFTAGESRMKVRLSSKHDSENARLVRD